MVDLIERGFVAQTILVVLVWGGIVFLAVTQRPVPTVLMDVGLMIVGFYFHTVMTQALRAGRSPAKPADRTGSPR